MFVTGDLPLVTASGVDPRVLAALPWRVRHPAAAAASLREVYALVEDFGDDLDAGAGDAEISGHPDDVAYQTRVDRCVSVHMTDDDLFTAEYGQEALAAEKARQAAERDALRAALQRQLDAVDGR